MKIPQKASSLIKKSEKYFNGFLWAVIIIFPFLHMFQGTDLMDTQYQLYNASYFFSSEAPKIMTIFADGLNAIFYLLCPRLITLYFIRSIISLALCFVSYKILKSVGLNKTLSLTGILLAEGFFLSLYNISDYNAYSCLVCLIAVFFIYFGITNKKYFFTALSGVISSLAIFFRFPNICIIPMILLAMLYFFIITKENIKESLKQYLIFISASVFVAVVIFFVLKCITPLSFVSVSLSTESDYSVSKLLYGYISQTISGFKDLIVPGIAILFLTATGFISKLKNKKHKIILYSLASVISVAVLAIYHSINISYAMITVALFVMGIIYTVVFSTKKHRNPTISFLLILGMILPVSMVAGSNTSIMYSRFSFFILLPLIINLIYRTLKATDFPKPIKIILSAGCLGVIAIFALKLFVINTVVFEPQNKAKLIYKSEVPVMSGIYTSENIADYADEAYRVIAPIDNEYLISYYAIDLYCITDKKSYINRPGIYFESYSAKMLETDINSQSDKDLPIICISKLNAFVLSEEKKNLITVDDKQQILLDFIKENNYSVYYDSNSFTVYLPYVSSEK